MKKIEITDKIAIKEIIDSTDVCTLALIDGEKPYCVPMNFAYCDEIVYFHGAPFGRKIEALNKNQEVCIAFYSEEKLNVRNENVACSYSMKYKSVLAEGKIVFVEDYDEKIRILNIIMKKYSGRDDFKYSKPAIDNVNVFYLKPENVTAYRRGY